MPLDTFICGSCHVTFNDIEAFIVHKRDGCEAADDDPLGQTVTYTVALECPDEGDAGSVEQSIISAITAGAVETETGDVHEVRMHCETAPYQMKNTEDRTVLVITAPDITMPEMKPVKKRGRPKKSEAAKKKSKVEPVKQEPGRLPLPDKDKFGKYLCSRCKKSFIKERHFNTHKCLANSDYVDISKSEVFKKHVDSGAEEEEDEPMLDPDLEDGQEYTLPDTRLTIHHDKDDDHDTDEEEVQNLANQLEGRGRVRRGDVTDSIHMSTDGDEEPSGPKLTDQIEDVPVFRSDTDKAEFESSLNVDLSGLDVMFRIHMVEQDVNEKASMPPRHTSSALFLYSCKTCEKVFKTLSHMRLHCLIHTDLKPFKCHKCSYTSNSKGNLYTHMRKHTGQFYKCGQCDFKTVNKSHLLEHEAIHTKEKHQCELCDKPYNTHKSLVNHIRKYHNKSKPGREYLQRFQTGRHARGMTVIHQCHVCNRKFKKKIDRDRHLFTHDIKDTPNVQHCSLCDYSATRRVYLEKHFQKHRVVYQCCECPERFLSTIRLIDHLTSLHLKDDPATKWESLFEQCINSSFYLPEPELDSFNAKSFVNLPPELAQIDGDEDNDDIEVESCSTVISLDNESTITVSSRLQVNKYGVVDGMSEATTDPADESVTDNTESVMTTTCADQSGQSTEESQTTDTANIESGNTSTVQENSECNSTAAGDETIMAIASMEDALEAQPGLEDSSVTTDDDIISRLGYRKLHMSIFHKMRETFGCEECEYCGRLFYSKADYELHQKTHTGDRPYSCDKCSYRAITKDNVRRHCEREHDNMKFPCGLCEFMANSRSQLWSHQLKHRENSSDLTCSICSKVFENLMDLKTHIATDHPDLDYRSIDLQKMAVYSQKSQGRRSYKCPYCDKVFIRANSELQKHIWIHEGIKPYKCPICPHACRSRNNLQAHMLRHSNTKPFTCTECGKAYKSRTALRWHTRSHKDGKLFKCDKCSYEATQRSHLKRHMETHDVVKRYVCQHCDFSANTIGYMKIHYTRHHRGQTFSITPSGEKVTPAETKVYKCLSCDYLFGNLSDMKRHLKVRHHVQVDNIYTVEPSEGAEVLAIGGVQPQENCTDSQVQVLHLGEAGGTFTAQEEDAGAALQALQNSVPQDSLENLDEKTASAVTILQQIIDMSQQGAFGQQQITMQSEDGQMVAVNSDTIIVQQEGEEVVVSSGSPDMDTTQQYVIQYVTPQEVLPQEPHQQTIPMEIQTVDQEVACVLQECPQ